MSLFIAVAGNIGTGKTTLAQMLGQQLGCEIFYESVDENPYLDDFYLDMKRWSFNIQIYFLSQRFLAHQKIIESNKSAIQDRTIYEDKEIFARALFEQGDMSPRDYQNYIALNNHMSSFLKAPDLLIYLRKSVPSLLKNIEKRNRNYEGNFPIEYLTRLNSYYDDWIDKYEHGPVLVLESDELDFVSNSRDFSYLLEKVQDALPQKLLLEAEQKNKPSSIKVEQNLSPAQPRLI